MRTISVQEEGNILSRLIGLRPQYNFSFCVSNLTNHHSDKFITVIPTTIQCTVVHKGESMSFRLSTTGTELDPFTVETGKSGDIVTLTGKMLSRIVLGVGSGRRHFTEIAPFKAVGVDAAIPGAGLDSFTLTIDYSASQGIGPLLLEALGTDLVKCKRGTCTLEVTGTLTDGEIEGHTTGGE
jgi:hypothetical protein